MTKEILLCIVIGYLLGNFQTSYILGRLIAKKDVREYGSQNAGTTNALRVFGARIAIATLILDLLKGVLAVYIGYKLAGDIGGMAAGLFVVIGHNWPVFLKFKGGKGVATSIGVALMITPISTLAAIVIGLLIIAKTKYVSLGALTSTGLWFVFNTVFYYKERGIYLVIMSFILFAMMLFRHRGNIKRLMAGEENKFTKKVS